VVKYTPAPLDVHNIPHPTYPPRAPTPICSVYPIHTASLIKYIIRIAVFCHNELKFRQNTRNNNKLLLAFNSNKFIDFIQDYSVAKAEIKVIDLVCYIFMNTV